MFRIMLPDNEYPDFFAQIKETNDINDLVDIAIGLFDEPLIENKIKNIAAWMNWGDRFETKDYTIECYKER